MNYRHIYHAGNFADVVKHIALIEIIEYYKKKDSSFFVLDAFAGIGKYSIDDERVSKTMEMQDGVLKLLRQENILTPEFHKYIELVKVYIQDGFYPGSPAIISDLLRKQDKAVFNELHPEDFLILKQMIPSAHNIDGYSAVRAFTPPQEKRGLIFLDPPFEKRDEFQKLLKSIEELGKRFRNGTIMIWYPIKESVEGFYQQAQQIHNGEQIHIEVTLNYQENSNISSNKLKRTGLLIINPTWGLEELLQKTAMYLSNNFISKS